MKFGFIGTGNMGSALAKAVAKSVPAEDIMLTDADMSKASALGELLGCRTGSLRELTEFSDYIFIGVKPQMLGTLFEDFGSVLRGCGGKCLVSMCAGTTLERITALAGTDLPVIRIMPNVACAVGEGVVLIAANGLVTGEMLSDFKDAMKYSGVCDEIPEKLIDAASAVSGCGPAYVFIMAEAMADGLVACGIPRDKAYLYAAQTLRGSAELMRQSPLNPSALKDSVCSPGGTTIEGVAALERNSFRYAVIEAVRASYEKNSKL